MADGLCWGAVISFMRPNAENVPALAIYSFLTLVAFLAVSSLGSAATLSVVGGELVGASNVVVDGKRYDVAFRDGTCASLFTGCDSVTDLTFDNASDALLASQALLDQVVIDSAGGAFDEIPSLTSGCADPSACDIRTLFVAHEAHHIAFGIARNVAEGFGANIVDGDVDSLPVDTATLPNVVFAVWRPVSVPGPGYGLALGLLVFLSLFRYANLVDSGS